MKKFLFLLFILPFCFACSKDGDNEKDNKFPFESLNGTIWENNDGQSPITLKFQQDSFCIFIVKETAYTDTLYYFYKFENPELYLNANHEMNLGSRPNFNCIVSRNKINAENEYGESMVLILKQ